MMGSMTRDEIRSVLDRVHQWPLDQQAYLARIAKYIEAQPPSIEREDDATRGAIAEGLEQARRGDFASEEEVEAAYARFRK